MNFMYFGPIMSYFGLILTEKAIMSPNMTDSCAKITLLRVILPQNTFIIKKYSRIVYIRNYAPFVEYTPVP